jgi:hypothetical protein
MKLEGFVGASSYRGVSLWSRRMVEAAVNEIRGGVGKLATARKEGAAVEGASPDPADSLEAFEFPHLV